jgi:L-lysine 2,3-aminomutase
VVLQFDHIGDDKSATVSRLVTSAYSWTRILLEIAKCEVVCANCHARRTARRHGGWIRALHPQS